MKIFKEFCITIYENPSEGLRLIKILAGSLIVALMGIICLGALECGKIILDKIKLKG